MNTGAVSSTLKAHPATRYLVPLREGGSLPAVLDTEDGGLFVTKFRGAGQGARALVAEIIVGQLASALGLPMPEMALIELDSWFDRSERDPEIRDILRGSVGLNVGHRYLDGALNFEPQADEVAPRLAAEIVWLDALVTNLDRTAHNPNLMTWRGEVWLIDHGSALYFHHDWSGVDADKAQDRFVPIAHHVLLAVAGDLEECDQRLAGLLSEEVVTATVAAVPDSLLMDAPAGIVPPFSSAEENREAYVDYLSRRLGGPRAFVEEAVAAQQRSRAAPPQRKSYRR